MRQVITDCAPVDTTLQPAKTRSCASFAFDKRHTGLWAGFMLAGLLLTGNTSFASSSSIIIVPAITGQASSISYVTCTECNSQPYAVKKTTTETAVTLPPGTQKIEIKEINGQKMLVRQAAWNGGSPATFLNRADIWVHNNIILAATPVSITNITALDTSLSANGQNGTAAPNSIDQSLTTAGVNQPAPRTLPQIGQTPLRLN